MVLLKMQSVLFMSACDVGHCCSLVISDSLWKDNQKLQVGNIFFFFFKAKLIKYLFHFYLKDVFLKKIYWLKWSNCVKSKLNFLYKISILTMYTYTCILGFLFGDVEMWALSMVGNILLPGKDTYRQMTPL